jgi:TolB protein
MAWRLRVAAWMFPAILGSACGGPAEPPEPETGAIRLTVSTTGEDLDPDGYTYSLDGGTPIRVAGSSTVLLANVAVGTRRLVFADVAGNCEALSPTTASVAVTGDATSEVSFEVACDVRLTIRTNTTGSDPDLFLILRLDGGAPSLVAANDAVIPLTGLSLGTHELTIRGVAPNCALSGSANRSIPLGVDDLVVEEITLDCSATTRRILFGSTRDGGYDLYVMDADGANSLRLTTGARPALHGHWSPDGAKIVFHSPGDTGFDILVMNADGSGLDTLVDDGADNLRPRWSPDGSAIAFGKADAVWVINADGSNPRAVATGRNPAWSPDGSQIAYNLGSAIWITDANGWSQRELHRFDGDYSDQPVWSPDGTKILFHSPRDGAYTDIFVMASDGTGAVNLTRSPGGVLNEDFDWSPDGTKIAFRTSRDGGNPEIYIMNADGSNPVSISPNIWDEYGPAWHP